MESSAQDTALELLAAFSIRVLRLLAVLGDTIRFPLLVSRVERNGSPLAEDWIGTLHILNAFPTGA